MSGIYSQSTLDQVRAANDIVDVIGSVLPLKRAGANFVTLCPFHKEKSPSFNVNPQRQYFHCFGCHKGGDVFTFIQEYENIGFAEALHRLAERARIPLETEQGSGQSQARFVKETLLKIHELITQRWHAALLNDAAGEIARAYLEKRGVSAEAVKLYRLGYAPEVWDDTVNWAKSKGFELPLVEQAGLILRKEGETRYYDRFRGRIMFPICDEQGRVIGFSGRILSGDEKTAKYVNSPETPIFTKGKIIFGLDKAKRALVDAQCAIICEGQLDQIACQSAGVANAVAPQGTALTAEQARILKRYVDEVVLCFDSDSAGQSAAIRSLDSLLAMGLAVRVATLPSPHDPDSFIKNFGGPAFQELISRAEGFFDFYLERLCKLHDPRTDKGQIAIVRSMAEAVQKTGNLVLLDRYARKTAFRLGVAPEAALAQFKKYQRPMIAGPESESEAKAGEGTATPLPEIKHREAWLLKMLLLHDDLVPFVCEHLDPCWVVHPLVREIVSMRMKLQQENAWNDLPGFLAQFEQSTMRALITDILNRPLKDDHVKHRTIPRPLDQLQDILRSLRNDSIDRELTSISRRAATLEPGSPDQVALLRQQQELRRFKQQPLIPKSATTEE